MLKLESVRPEQDPINIVVLDKTLAGVLRRRTWGELTGQEAVQLHKELEIDIVALRRLAVRVAHMVSVEIDT